MRTLVQLQMIGRRGATDERASVPPVCHSICASRTAPHIASLVRVYSLDTVALSFRATRTAAQSHTRSNRPAATGVCSARHSAHTPRADPPTARSRHQAAITAMGKRVGGAGRRLPTQGGGFPRWRPSWMRPPQPTIPPLGGSNRLPFHTRSNGKPGLRLVVV